MNQKMQAYSLFRPYWTVNEWGDQVKDWTTVGMIRAAISMESGKLTEQEGRVRFQSVHRGLTYDDVRVGDRLVPPGGDGRGFFVESVNVHTHCRQLTLSREEGLRHGAAGDRCPA